MKYVLFILFVPFFLCAAPATNKVVVIKGAATAKSLLKTQPANAVRVKYAKNKTVDLPLMFNNNRLPKLKKETKK